MMKPSPTMAQMIAEMSVTLQAERTGQAPGSVTVVFSDDTLVITLHEALTPAEKELARTKKGAEQVQEFHRALFASTCDAMRERIKKITGIDVLEAASEIETASGAVIHAFTTGTVVQVFLLSEPVSYKYWREDDSHGPVVEEAP
ncbi:MAG: DUF2294 domain-containing protein [Phycisphaerales bacterium]